MSDLFLADEAHFRERGFFQAMGFGKRPALLVIDLTKGFTDPARPLGAELGSQVFATNQLLDAAHARAVPVFVSAVRYDDPDIRDAGIWSLKHRRGSETMAADGDGHEVDARLRVHAGDSRLYKKYASCFFGTDFSSRLVAAGVDTLIITGTSTSGCVRATTVDAVQSGFRPMVVREAVGDRADAAHHQSLFDIQAKYGDVVSLEETLAYLAALTCYDTTGATA